jgi:hypothetical protein
MRLDSANRSFLALMTLALLLGMYVLCGAVGSVLVPLVLARISHDGIDGLMGSGGSLLPALLFIVLVAVGLTFGARSISRQTIAASRLALRVREVALELPDDLAQPPGGKGVWASAARGRAIEGRPWPRLERARWRGGDRRPRAAGRSRRSTGDRHPAKDRNSLTRATASLLGAVLFAAVFLAAVLGFGGPVAVYRATGTGLTCSAV